MEPVDRQVSWQEIAHQDLAFQAMLDELHKKERNVETLSRELGAKHPDMIAAIDERDEKEREVRRYADWWERKNGTTTSTNPNAIAELQAELDSVVVQKEVVSEKTRELGKKVQSIESLMTDQEENLEKLAETKSRIEHLTVESAISGRLAIISHPEVPSKPAKDLRIPIAGAGAVGGVVLGFAIILLIGLLRQRFRHIEDVTEGLDKYRMLGVVPELPENLKDAEHSEISALCLHQIRALLQLEPRGDGGQVFSVTSPCPRDGKSTLTLALGLSFAAAGSRVLVVDCDLIGRGLSTQIHRMIRGNVSEVLNPNRADDRRALESGLDELRRLDAIVGLLNRARRSHQMNGSDEIANLLRLSEENEKLGEATVQNLVFLADREAEAGGSGRLWQALEEKARTMREGSSTALVTKGSQSLGLMDVIDGTDLEVAVANTGVPNLCFLPPGTSLQPEPDGTPPAALARLSPRTVAKVIDLARRHFDAVVVDTGPMPGSLEASVLATQVDAVIVTLAQGSSVSLAEKTLKHLRSIGAHVGGIVYNRAPAVEIIRSSYMRSSLASRRDQS
jgi:Mrp family chromosome partitioning ATPase